MQDSRPAGLQESQRARSTALAPSARGLVALRLRFPLSRGGASVRRRSCRGRPAAVAAVLVCLLGGGCSSGDRAVLRPLRSTRRSPRPRRSAAPCSSALGRRGRRPSGRAWRCPSWSSGPSSGRSCRRARPERGAAVRLRLGRPPPEEHERVAATRGAPRRTGATRCARWPSGARRRRTRRTACTGRAILDLVDEEGNGLTLPLFGSILERNGEFKLFSFVVD